MNRLLCMLVICNLGILYWPGSESRASQAERPRMWPGLSSSQVQEGREASPSLSDHVIHLGIPKGQRKHCGMHGTTKMPILDKILCMQQHTAASSSTKLLLSLRNFFLFVCGAMSQ